MLTFRQPCPQKERGLWLNWAYFNSFMCIIFFQENRQFLIKEVILPRAHILFFTSSRILGIFPILHILLECLSQRASSFSYISHRNQSGRWGKKTKLSSPSILLCHQSPTRSKMDTQIYEFVFGENKTNGRFMKMRARWRENNKRWRGTSRTATVESQFHGQLGWTGEELVTRTQRGL